MITGPSRYEQTGSADWATGACMLITPECRRLVGAWDEAFFLYSEETDYAMRARDAGLSLRYQPAASATHRGGDAHRSPALFELLTVNRWRLYRRRHGPVAAAIFRAALIVDMLPRAVAGRPTARAALTGLLSRGTKMPAIAGNSQ
jgi:GT2 family glycosyltransferase